MCMPVSAACQSCSFLGGQQQLLHIPVFFFLLSKKIFMLVLDCFFLMYLRHKSSATCVYNLHSYVSPELRVFDSHPNSCQLH